MYTSVYPGSALMQKLNSVACDFSLFFLFFVFGFRDGSKEPTFSKVISALTFFNKASIRRGKVIFHGKPKVKSYNIYCAFKSICQETHIAYFHFIIPLL